MILSYDKGLASVMIKLSILILVYYLCNVLTEMQISLLDECNAFLASGSDPTAYIADV